MPLHIGRVESEIEMTPQAGETESGRPAAPAAARRGMAAMTDGELRRRLRPIVMEILEEELATFQRRHG